MALLLAAASPGSAALAEATVVADPTEVAPGEVLTMKATGFPASVPVEIGAGPPYSEYIVVEEALTNVEGSLTRRYTISRSADPGSQAVIVVATQDHAVKASSETVTVLEPRTEEEGPAAF